MKHRMAVGTHRAQVADRIKAVLMANIKLRRQMMHMDDQRLGL